ncbi:hypothetical protein [Butyrivibrio hungatei]|uniref:Uncharacterized protein n=1 Tax=Butyrivibrio hungatei TaxID=185008 RepID=A0A1D9P5Q6_9FIRM|nr:hypothetical protein [Butyrivibrio hungatei]AOZ97907.1 hypothetical protein bhn_II108 [Butyrivibrio hungatei]
MINNVSNIHLDRPATQAKILSIAQSKGLSVQEYNKSIKEMSARYREAAHKKRLSEIDKYVVIAQALHIGLLSDLLVITEK